MDLLSLENVRELAPNLLQFREKNKGEIEREGRVMGKRIKSRF